MAELPERDGLLTEFIRERSVRRTVTVLEAKRKRIRDELQQLVSHITLLVPLAAISRNSTDANPDVLQEALARLGDEAFAQLLLQILQEING